MEEVVAKSKLKKHERQIIKEEVTDLTEQVDKDWLRVKDLLSQRVCKVSLVIIIFLNNSIWSDTMFCTLGCLLIFIVKQDALGAYTCAISWIKCESFWFYWVLAVYARLGFSVQYIKYYIKWLKTSTQIKKKTRGKPKLVPRFVAGTSN